VFKPGQSLSEFVDADLLKGIFKLDVFNSVKSHVAKYFKHKKLQQILEFPVLFLGALSEKIPALYSLMNYADIKGGTWYPEGGMYQIVEAMYKLAIELGVEFCFNESVESFHFSGSTIQSVITNNNGTKKVHDAAVVISGADYHHIENLLPKQLQSYSEKYWDTRTMAPSCLLYYVGLNKNWKIFNITLCSLILLLKCTAKKFMKPNSGQAILCFMYVPLQFLIITLHRKVMKIYFS